ncbi:uncharacterized protein LOC107809092 isoform X2 [Nicotiana tabacum]|uniref:Uncharacterized protein LOC107809092 isoform X2 n=1 Tax=Nicotiana tabacum TaxID=4097 RepID=A0AC58SFC3_TOBAC|nr:MRN complex-interacting protein isoform X2 [Nicotiana tomentosiformis]
MPTVFVAVQCCQCSTMQVKQQKKSSNKWTCVVCNQKQSVRKVFAQGYKAKDVRLFVQNFNMSRQFTDQLPVVGREETETLEIGEQNQSHRSYKRTDWTEYLDPEENAIENNEDSGDVMEPKIVTELPKELFRKPKLNKYSAVEGHFRPVFSKRNARKQSTSQGMEPSKRQATMTSMVSKWGDNKRVPPDMSVQPATDSLCKLDDSINLYGNDNSMNERNLGYGKSTERSQPKTANKVSKWTEYINVDEDDCQLRFASGRGFTSDVNKWSNDTFGTSLKDQKLDDEEIHPHFLSTRLR